MLLAPDCCRHGSTLVSNGDNVMLISSGALDRSDIESQDMSSLVRTFDVHRSATMLARHTGALARFADFANLLEARARN